MTFLLISLRASSSRTRGTGRVVPISEYDGYTCYLSAGASGTVTLTGAISDMASTGFLTVTGHIYGDCPDRPDIIDLSICGDVR